MSERIAQLPLKRLGSPKELAAAVAFFCSKDAGFITGASLQVDGGMVGALQ
jgi:acetoacetyl-CoA reductase